MIKTKEPYKQVKLTSFSLRPELTFDPSMNIGTS